MGSLRVQGRKTKKHHKNHPRTNHQRVRQLRQKQPLWFTEFQGMPTLPPIPTFYLQEIRPAMKGTINHHDIPRGPYLFRGRKSFFKTGEKTWAPKTFNSGWEHENSSVVFSFQETEKASQRAMVEEESIQCIRIIIGPQDLCWRPWASTTTMKNHGFFSPTSGWWKKNEVRLQQWWFFVDIHWF